MANRQTLSADISIILETLRHEAPMPLSVGELSAWTEISRPRVQRALKVILEGGDVRDFGNGYWGLREENDRG